MSAVAGAIIIVAMLLSVGIASYALTGSPFLGYGTTWGTGQATPAPSGFVPTPTPNSLVTTSAPLFGLVTDKFLGTTTSTNTVIIYPYGSDQALTSTTTSIDGSYNTTGTLYTSGQVVNVYWATATTAYSKLWTQMTIPQVASGGIYTNGYITMPLTGFTNGTYTAPALTWVGNTTALTSGQDDYYTNNGTTPTFQYKLTNTGASGTGLIESRDPNVLVNGQAMQWGVYLVVKFSGVSSEAVNLNNAGFDGHFSVGTTQYGYIHLDPNALTIWKNADGSYKTYGNNEKYQGTQTVTFSPDFTGVGSATTVVMTVNTYMYTDPAYALANSGNWGSYKVALVPTANLVDILYK